MTPAVPMWARLAEAALEVVVEAPAEVPVEVREAEVVAGLEVAAGEEAPVAGAGVVVPATGVEAPVVAPPVAGGGAAVPAEPEAGLPTQLVSEPWLTLKGADWATKPALSRRVRPREVPTGWLTVQVKEVPF